MRRLLNGPFSQALRSGLAWFGSAMRRYGAIVLAGSLPLLAGLGAVALLPPDKRSSVFIYQENLALFAFWREIALSPVILSMKSSQSLENQL